MVDSKIISYKREKILKISAKTTTHKIHKKLHSNIAKMVFRMSRLVTQSEQSSTYDCAHTTQT